MSDRTNEGWIRPMRAALLNAAVCAAPLVLLAGCAAFPTMNTSPSLVAPGDASASSGSGPDAPAASGSVAPNRHPQRLAIPPSSPPQAARQPATQAQIDALVPDEPADVTLAPQPIPQFVASVFSQLNLPYTMNADVATRPEIIAGGTGGRLSKRALFRLTQQALKQYGIDVFIDGQVVSVGGSQASSIGAEVVRSRTTPDTGGRVVQFFPVQTLDVNSLQVLLRDLFPNLGGARITVDALTNSLVITGAGRDVAQVTRTIRELDQPRFSGSEVLRIEPTYLSTEALSKALEDVMKTEGYLTITGTVAPRALVILPFPSANQILIFSQDPDILARADYWVGELDRPAALGDKASTFVYEARNTDAQSLGSLAMGQSAPATTIQTPVGVPGSVPVSANRNGQDGSQRAGGSASGAGQFMDGRIITDPIGNRILFTGTATQYAQLRTLLAKLDVPAPQVVIEVMIAEVTLTDSTSLGVNLFGTETRGDGVATGSTSGIALGSGALNLTFVGPDYRAQLIANASNNRVNILQRPQLVARSGGTARFQVGTDVPIITSQSASGSQTGGSTDILQSVQYRQTGTILEISPIVYGDRVDLTISQELSSAGDATGGISSPPILNRSLSTQIAVRDGWTGVLGGLIGNNYTKNNTGVPFLKDVPLIGSAFQNNRVTGERTELLLLITPYIVRGDEDMADFADEYSASMNAAFRTGRGWSYTLTPWSISDRFRGVGLDLPSPLPANETPRLLPERRARPD